MFGYMVQYETDTDKKGITMKKTFMLIGLLSMLLTGCNKQVVDTAYRFTYAQILMPDGSVIDGKVSSWTDFEDGDQIQLTIDGITYLTHSSNVVLSTKSPYSKSGSAEE